MASSPAGLYGSLRNLLTQGVELLHTRLELVLVELAEEKLRLLRLLAFGAMAFFLLGVGAVFLATFLTVLMWDEHRLLFLGLFSALFLGLGAVSLYLAWRNAEARSGLLAATLGELSEDRAALKAAMRSETSADE